MQQQIITTLYEGHYHLGVAALINSLVSASFEGVIYIGYRGELPYWTSQLKKGASGYSVSEQIDIVFEPIETSMHFGYYKPYFLQSVFLKFPDARKAYYFDPDIVVTGPWSFFSSWTDTGVALCLDSNFAYVHPNHPWRKEWRRLADAEDNIGYNVDFYVNSGFIGLNRQHETVLDKWIQLTEKYRHEGGDLSQFQKAEYRAFKGDQDLLNATITVLPNVSFSVIGKEGMGFSGTTPFMAHATNAAKPWKKNFLQSSMQGVPPALAEKAYWDFANHPVKLFSSARLKQKLLSIKIASLISRFYKKV